MSKLGTILVVEDEQIARTALTRLLQGEGYQVQAAACAADARKYLNEKIDLVLSDLRLGDASGIELLKWWHDANPATPFVLMTAFGEIAEAVQAMKLGADDFLSKPIHTGQLIDIVSRCVGRNHGAEAESHVASESGGLDEIVGDSAAMREVKRQILRAARSESTILIVGESGTGKELVANGIHANSRRRSGPYIAVNMAAVPETLVESELFGHVKGSFTGASQNRIGRLQAAQCGTIFIDEIGDFALASQAKLLRVLETKIITPVGGNDEKAVDVRVVAATSRNLEAMVASHEFREDLYYRLSVVTLTLPPLRKRLEDVPLLVRHFVAQLARSNQRTNIQLDHDVMRFLETYEWPGNVRQLRNTLESMIVMSDKSTLGMNDLPPALLRNERDTVLAVPPDATIRDLEKSAILRTLEECQGNRTRAAESLGISVRTLQRRLHHWGINTPG